VVLSLVLVGILNVSTLVTAIYVQFPNAELFIPSLLWDPNCSIWIHILFSLHVPILVAGTLLTISSIMVGFVLFVYLVLCLEVELK
jgi:hypothetical protein